MSRQGTGRRPRRRPGRGGPPWRPDLGNLLLTLGIITMAPLLWLWNDPPVELFSDRPSKRAPERATPRVPERAAPARPGTDANAPPAAGSAAPHAPA